mmetsp:Transcript_26753/g.92330  ORF Transcript_26753/g.92330 Transcript_26753/m.92330 type:complete len:207 (-) Transcript_26753:95-715(-)
MLPSTRDAVSEFVYPQPPLHDVQRGAGGVVASWDSELPLGSLEVPAAVLRVANPGVFAVNEVVFASTATDVLLHLSQDELASDRAVDAHGELAQLPRVARLASHLLQQRSLYPLFPPSAADAPLDLRQHRRWRLPLAPDLLLAPSKLAPFAHQIRSTLVVNPGHLAKAQGGGTFAQIHIHTLDLAETQGNTEHKVPERTRVEITRI